MARQLSAIREPSQRQSALARLLATESQSAHAWLHHWILRARRGGAGFTVALDAAAMVLTRSDLLGYEQRSDMYQAAKSAELEHVAFLLLEETAADESFEPERPLDPRGRPLTLGERKSLARGSRRDLLEKLLADPHPAVVEILLGNPMLTERDVLTITSRRPISGLTLLRVVSSEKFRPRPAVRRSLCLNPNLPVLVAARLMTTLGDRDLREIGGDRNLSAHLRLHAKRLLDLRDEFDLELSAAGAGA